MALAVATLLLHGALLHAPGFGRLRAVTAVPHARHIRPLAVGDDRDASRAAVSLAAALEPKKNATSKSAPPRTVTSWYDRGQRLNGSVVDVVRTAPLDVSAVARNSSQASSKLSEQAESERRDSNSSKVPKQESLKEESERKSAEQKKKRKGSSSTASPTSSVALDGGDEWAVRALTPQPVPAPRPRPAAAEWRP